MRAFIKNYIAAEQARREENDEKGFSLIELIIVVVVLGILAAIAIPIFIGIQDDAAQSSIDAVAANAASQAAVEISQGTTPAFANFDATVTMAGTTLDDFCVTATDGTKTATSGPGC